MLSFKNRKIVYLTIILAIIHFSAGLYVGYQIGSKAGSAVAQMFEEAMEKPDSIDQAFENTMADIKASTSKYRTVQYALSLPLAPVIIPIQSYLSKEYLYDPLVSKEKNYSEVKNIKILLLIIDFGRSIINSIVFSLCVVGIYYGLQRLSARRPLVNKK